MASVMCAQPLFVLYIILVERYVLSASLSLHINRDCDPFIMKTPQMID